MGSGGDEGEGVLVGMTSTASKKRGMKGEATRSVDAVSSRTCNEPTPSYSWRPRTWGDVAE